MKNYFCIMLFCFLSQIVFSQNSSKIDSLKKLGRDALIKLAVKELNEPAFNPVNYDRIVVKVSKTSIVVEFSLSIVVKGSKSCFYDAVNVAIIGGGSSKSIEGDCDEPKFYKASQADKNAIAFVFNAINKSKDIGHIPDNKLPQSSKMEISDHPAFYYIEFSDSYLFSHYKINKNTGKISEAGHKEYDRSGEKEDEFEIIK